MTTTDTIPDVGRDMAADVRTLARFAEEAFACTSCDGADQWYYRKHAQIAEAARLKGYSLAEAAAAYAVLSANASVLENDRNFVRVLHGARSIGFGDRQTRAELALSGDVSSALAYKNGEKIPSFFDNLYDPATSEACTLDRHAADIVTGSRRESKRILGRGHRLGYRYLGLVYRTVARLRRLRDHELQARVWVHHTTCTATSDTKQARARKVRA